MYVLYMMIIQSITFACLLLDIRILTCFSQLIALKDVTMVEDAHLQGSALVQLDGKVMTVATVIISVVSVEILCAKIIVAVNIT